MFPTSSYVACLVPSWWCYLGRCWKLWKGGGPSPRVGQWRDCIGDLFPFLCFLSVTRWEPPLPHTWAAVTSGLDSCSQTSRVWSESKHVFPCAWLLMLNILSLQCNRNEYMSHGLSKFVIRSLDTTTLQSLPIKCHAVPSHCVCRCLLPEFKQGTSQGGFR